MINWQPGKAICVRLFISVAASSMTIPTTVGLGIQLLRVMPDPAFNPSGSAPVLRDVHLADGSHTAVSSLQTGRSYYSCNGPNDGYVGDCGKTNAHRISTTTIGANTVTLKNSADAAKLRVGRYHLIGSYDQQMGGFPPNLRYFEWVKVVSVSGATVTLDRPLRFKHKENNFESNDPNSIGPARIIVIDRDDVRITQKATYSNLVFAPNPNSYPESVTTHKIVWVQGGMDVSFENCSIGHIVPTTMRYARFQGGSVGAGEPDKLVSMLIF